MYSKQQATRINNMHRANQKRTELAIMRLQKKRRTEGLTSAEEKRLTNMINKLVDQSL